MNTYTEFLKQFEANKPFEDLAIEKAVDYFTSLSPVLTLQGSDQRDKPYTVLRRPDGTNYRELRFDAEIGTGETTIRIEVKTDHKSTNAGNFFIEYVTHGKPSGIAITDADFYVISNTVDYHLISV